MSSVYIIGNGDSMNEFDYSTLDGKDVIVINNGYRRKPDAMMMLFSDDSFYAENREPRDSDDFRKFSGQIFTDCKLVSDTHPRIAKIDPKMLKVKSGKKKFDASDKNTGLKAICFALNLGYDEVLLLGFDGRPNASGVPAQEVYDRYRLHHIELAALGLPIKNLTPNSALDMYETNVTNGALQ